MCRPNERSDSRENGDAPTNNDDEDEDEDMDLVRRWEWCCNKVGQAQTVAYYLSTEEEQIHVQSNLR